MEKTLMLARTAQFAAAGFVAMASLGAAAWAGADSSGFKVIDKIAAGGQGGWDYVTADSDTRQVLISRGGSIMAIDADTGKVRLNIATANHAHQALTLPGGKEILITNGGDQTATIVSAIDGKVRATVKTSAGPDAAILDPTTGLALVMGNKSGVVDLIDVKAGVSAGQIVVGGALEYAAADGQGHVFVNVEDRGELVEVDVKARKIIARHKLLGCEEPSGLAYIAPEQLLLSACANGVAKVTSAVTGKVTETLIIGPRPDAALYDAERKLAFIPSGGDGTLSVIAFNGERAKVIDTVATAKGARTGAVDPKTGKIFLAAARYAPSAQSGGWPIMVPGSFQVLVVGR